LAGVDYEHIRDLIIEYRRKPNHPTLLRNLIFERLFPEIKKTILGIAGKEGRYIEQPEAVSLSWDYFLYFMASYNEDYYVLAHLHRYAWYWLQKICQNRQRQIEKMEALDEAIVGDHIDEPYEEPQEMEGIKELLSFRELCTDREKLVFDWILSNGFEMSPDEFEGLRKRSGLSHYGIRSLIFAVRRFVLPFSTGRRPKPYTTKADGRLPPPSEKGPPRSDG
jgi:hypothetical protein